MQNHSVSAQKNCLTRTAPSAVEDLRSASPENLVFADPVFDPAASVAARSVFAPLFSVLVPAFPLQIFSAELRVPPGVSASQPFSDRACCRDQRP